MKEPNFHYGMQKRMKQSSVNLKTQQICLKHNYMQTWEKGGSGTAVTVPPLDMVPIKV